MWLYDLLLRLYPASFRNEYGGEMRGVLARDLARATSIGRLALLLRNAAELVVTAVAVHADILHQDLVHTVRMLRRAPGFALTSVVVIALGIGATTAAFSVTDFVLFRPLPFPEPERLVKVWESTPGYPRMELSAPNYRDWKAAARSFDSMGTYHFEEVTLLDRGDPKRLNGSSVSADLFPTLGVEPALGRGFSPEDDRQGAAGTVVLSHRLWVTEFGADPDIVGRALRFDDGQYTVVGVMPREFHFPTSDVEFWVATRFGERDYADDERTNNWLEAVGRLRPGATLEQARAELDAVAARLREAFPKENEATGAAVVPLGAEVSERSRLMLVALLGASACVLLIACANLANLLLARVLSRRRELALRAAIGAGRERLARQLLTESLFLAGTGGVLGVLVAAVSVPLLAQLVPATLPIAESPAVDLRVLAFALGVTALTGVLFGLAPVLHTGDGASFDGLRDGVRAGGGARERLRSALVVAEIAASVVLLVSAGLLLRALGTVQAVPPGFRPAGVLTLRIELPNPEYDAVSKREAFYAHVLDRVSGLPGVTAAGFVSFLPMSSFRGGIWPVSLHGAGEASGIRSADTVAVLRYVTPGYFAAAGIPLLRGRDIARSDTQKSLPVAVVSESFVRRYWPGENPIGRRFTFAFNEREVVGVVGDVRFRGLERQSEPQVYLSSPQVADGGIVFYAPRALAIRTTGEPSALLPQVRAIVREADAKLPIVEAQPFTRLVQLETASRSVQVRVLTAFAALAFVLAAIGIHGLLSFMVSQRTQEIGVRVALGAQTRDILSMIARRVLLLVVAGVVPGMLLAYVAGRSMSALLAGVAPADPRTLAAAIALCVFMTLAGSLVATRRALGVDPVTALRAE